MFLLDVSFLEKQVGQKSLAAAKYWNMLQASMWKLKQGWHWNSSIWVL